MTPGISQSRSLTIIAYHSRSNCRRSAAARRFAANLYGANKKEWLIDSDALTARRIGLVARRSFNRDTAGDHYRTEHKV
jgi:hypothetical protein